MTIQVLNGPNIGRLGLREPEKYGTTTYAELVELVEATAREMEVEVQVRQTDDEGEMLRWVHAASDAGDSVLINPGGWSHTSVALRDALAGQAGLPARPEVDRHPELVPAMGPPTRYSGGWQRPQSVMRGDKKARGAPLRFVVLDGLGNPTILTDPDQAWLDAAWAVVSGDDA